MRRSLAILALLGLLVTYAAGTARADGVGYNVSGTYAAVTGTPSTPLSNPGDRFTFTFSVDPTKLMDLGGGMSNAINITNLDYSDSSGHSFTNQTGMVTFFTEAQFGLFMVQFDLGGGMFFLFLEGPDAGFNEGPPPTLNTSGSPFPITPGDTTGMAENGGSVLGDCENSDCSVFSVDAILKGSVDVTPANAPEPSSLLLLGSGFIALGSFARRRFSTSRS